MSYPKTLIQRLEWMAHDLLGFQEARDVVAEIVRAAALQISPARSGARTAEICMAVGTKADQSTLISEE